MGVQKGGDGQRMRTKTLLIVDDEESICFALRRFFETRGMRVLVAPNLAAASRCCSAERPDVVFLDVCLPDGNGLDLLEKLGDLSPGSRAVVMTAYGSLDTVTRAMRHHAFEYLVKPLDLTQAEEAVSHILAGADGAGGDDGAGEFSRVSGTEGMIGRTPAIQEVFKRIGRVTQSDVPVLIIGETGTGKELVARAIHAHGPRRSAPFVAVNCGALPENLIESELFGYVKGTFTGADRDKPGRFELADGGTLLLDEVGDMPPAAQVKLLRFLDSGAIERLGSTVSTTLDVRILAATNRDLREAVQRGAFRADLFYRVAVIQIPLPPLRDRREDIPLLARYFLNEAADGHPVSISREAEQRLVSYDWPGNVRELRNAILHAKLLSSSGPILPVHLPETVINGCPGQSQPAADAVCRAAAEFMERVGAADGEVYPRTVAALDDFLVQHALRKTGGNQVAAAEYLGIHRNTLRQKIAKLRDRH